MSVFTGKTASIYISGAALTLTNEATTDVGGLHTTYQITNTAKRILDRTYTTLVESSPDGSTWSTELATGYTLENLTGTVTFLVAKATGTQIRMSGQYLPVSILANAKDWALSIDSNLVNTTTLKSTWKSQTALVREGTVKFSQFYADNYFLTNLGNLCVLILWVDEANGIGYKAYGYIKNDSIKVMEEDVISEDVMFNIDKNFCYINNF